MDEEKASKALESRNLGFIAPVVLFSFDLFFLPHTLVFIASSRIPYLKFPTFFLSLYPRSSLSSRVIIVNGCYGQKYWPEGGRSALGSVSLMFRTQDPSVENASAACFFDRGLLLSDLVCQFANITVLQHCQ